MAGAIAVVALWAYWMNGVLLAVILRPDRLRRRIVLESLALSALIAAAIAWVRGLSPVLMVRAVSATEVAISPVADLKLGLGVCVLATIWTIGYIVRWPEVFCVHFVLLLRGAEAARAFLASRLQSGHSRRRVILWASLCIGLLELAIILVL